MEKKRRIVWLLLAAITFGSAGLIFRAYEAQHQVYTTGHPVIVTVTGLPDSLAKEGVLVFIFNGKSYHKFIAPGLTQKLQIGDQVRFWHVDGEDKFLGAYEDQTGATLGMVIFMFFCGICFVHFACKREPPAIVYKDWKIA